MAVEPRPVWLRMVRGLGVKLGLVVVQGERAGDEGAGVLPHQAMLPANADDLASFDDDDVAVLADDGALLGGPPGSSDEARQALLPLATSRGFACRGAGQKRVGRPRLAAQAVEAGARRPVVPDGRGRRGSSHGGEEGGEATSQRPVQLVSS